jgi:Ca-activated chloride channel family protein
MIGDFHFIRPWWLLALLPLALLVWAIYRRQDPAQMWRTIIAPNLLPFLLSGATQRKRISPLLLIGIGWLVSVVAIAGPTWRREPAPFADETAALAIVVKVSPSMKVEDVQPDRLTRAVQKVRDLLGERRGAKTALIAYAGSAHVVMPSTTDDGIINTFAQALDPRIMPAEGDAAAEALHLADQVLHEAGSGSILWITDSIAPEQTAPLSQWRKQSSTEVRVFPPLLAGSELDALKTSARMVNPSLVRLSADDSDIDSIARSAKFSNVASGEKGARWEESGYWLTPVLVGLLLPFFRKGWMARTAAQ